MDISHIESMDFYDVTNDLFDNIYAVTAAISAVIAGVSVIMEKRRNNRKNVNKVGFMPWNLISVISTLGFVIMTALAIKIG